MGILTVFTKGLLQISVSCSEQWSWSTFLSSCTSSKDGSKNMEFWYL